MMKRLHRLGLALMLSAIWLIIPPSDIGIPLFVVSLVFETVGFTLLVTKDK